MPSIVVFVPYEAAFPNEPNEFSDFRDILRRLSRTDSLIWCARVNLVLGSRKSPSLHETQEKLVKRLVPQQALDRINRWATRGGYASNQVAVFFREQVLELAYWIAAVSEDQRNDGKTFDDSRTREDFFRAALLVSDAWGSRIRASELKSTASKRNDRRGAMRAFRHAMAAGGEVPWAPRLLARSVAVCTHGFRAHYRDVDEVLTKGTGLSLAEYQAFSTILALRVQGDTRDPLLTPPYFDLRTWLDECVQSVRPAFERYISLISQTSADLRSSVASVDGEGWNRTFNHLSLRRRPVLHFPRGHIIPDATFMLEKLTVGPLFELARIERRRQNEAFGAYGKGIEYYARTLLTGMLPDRPPLTERVIPNPMGTRRGELVEIADVACVLGAYSYALVEVKAAFLPEFAVLADEPVVYEQEVLTRYARAPGEGTAERMVGVTQLADRIASIARGTLTWSRMEPNAECTIYPILLVHDVLVAGPGHTELLQDAFLKALDLDDGPQLPTVKLGSFRIRPLILATLDDLEVLEGSLTNISLVQALDEFVATGMNHTFHDYLAINQVRFEVKLGHLARETSMELIRQSVQLVLGRSLDEVSG
jgi:hypothetical protein